MPDDFKLFGIPVVVSSHLQPGTAYLVHADRLRLTLEDFGRVPYGCEVRASDLYWQSRLQNLNDTLGSIVSRISTWWWRFETIRSSAPPRYRVKPGRGGRRKRQARARKFRRT